jgi:hypothetical protein
LEFKNIILEEKLSNILKNSHDNFSGVRVSVVSKRTWELPDISYFIDLRPTGDDKKIPKTVLKTRLKTKETTYTLILQNTLWSLFQATQRGHCFWSIH